MLGILAFLLIMGIVAMVVVCERAKKFNHAYNVRKEARRLFRRRSSCIGDPNNANETVDSIASPEHGAAASEGGGGGRRMRSESVGSMESGGSWDSYTTGRTGQSVVSPSNTLYVSCAQIVFCSFCSLSQCGTQCSSCLRPS